jgi:hypothetical protein
MVLNPGTMRLARRVAVRYHLGREGHRMVRMLLLAIAVAATGCAEVKQSATAIDTRNAEMNAAVHRMIVVQGREIPGHPSYTELGAVQGYCEKTPRGDQQIVPGDNMKQAAYRKYGARADAIINAQAWFVLSAQASAEMEPGSSEGHFECAGTAVTFAEAAPAQ